MACKATSGLLGLLLVLSSASGSFAQPATPQMKHGQEPGYHHSFGNAETWVREFDDPARDAWQKPDDVLDALQLAHFAVGHAFGDARAEISRAGADVCNDGKVFAADIEPDMLRYLGERAHR